MSNCSFTPYQQKANSKKDFTLKSFLTEKTNNSVSLFGYPDDEGIAKNGGKIGAALGPDSIRAALYKMTPAPSMTDIKIKDHGNLNFTGSSLEDRHDFAAVEVASELQQNKTCISFGGGHDYGYVDGAAFLKSSIKTKSSNSPKPPVIFNFDAHFDLRNLDKGISSGTPFFRLVKDFGEDFELFEIGIQKHCNSLDLFNYAGSKKNITTLNYDDLYPLHEFDFKYFKKTVEDKTTPKQDCYISVDIDGFSSAFAPGCSQSWPTGFDIKSFFKMFDYLMSRFNVSILGVYEVSPPLDHEELTSRLAALITYRFLDLKSKKAKKV